MIALALVWVTVVKVLEGTETWAAPATTEGPDGWAKAVAALNTVMANTLTESAI
jgi:hypothetical protein